MPLTQDLAQFCTSLRYEEIPEEALAFIRIGFTDCFATLVAGRDSDEVRILFEVLQPCAGDSRLLVSQGTARAPEAAWINATAAHALDFDDAAQRGHISAVVVPAILAEADASGADGRRMAAAYAAGYETWADLMRREPDHYHNHSWHPTGVFGPIAAAAACASLRGLSAAQAVHALSLAASQSAGLIANFGSMTKPFHAGRAAHAGVMAARLAQKGFTASPDALEHPKGWMQGVSPAGRADVDSAVQAGRYWKLPRGGLNIKKYPLCFATHRALDGMLKLLQEHPLQLEQVRRIAVTTSRRNRATLRFTRPETASQAKFSMQFAMASALIAGGSGLLELQDAFLQRGDVQRAMGLVEVLPEDVEDPLRPGEAPWDVVQIDTHDGHTFTRSVDYVRGGPELPLVKGELFAKFSSCLRAGGMRVEPRPLFDALMGLDRLAGTRAIYALAAA